MLSLLLLAAAPTLQASAPLQPDLADFTPRWQQAMGACGVAALAMVLVEGDEVVHRVTLGRRDPERELPVANADAAWVLAESTLTLALSDLKTNDRDDDGDLLHITAIATARNGDLAVTLGVVDLVPPATIEAAEGAVFTARLADGSALPG